MPITYEVELEYSDTVEEGVVIRQEPEPGQYDPNDDIVITLYVSSGPADPEPEPEPEPDVSPTINLAVYLGGRSTSRYRRRYY